MGKRLCLCMFAAFYILLPLFANGEKEQDKTDGPLVIDWLAYDTYNRVDPESMIVKAMEEKYNVRFNIWFIDDQRWEEALAVRIASGEMPDYMKMKGSQSIRRYVDQGILTPVTDEMMEMVPEYNRIMDEVDPEGIWRIVPTIDGKLYGLRKFNLNGAYPTVLVWRKDWLENVGITAIPETIEEFEEAMYKFTFDDPDGNGVDDTYGLSETVFHSILGAFGHFALVEFTGEGGTRLFIRDGKYEYAPIQPGMKEALELLRKWYADGVIDPEFITGENKGGYWAVSHSFVNGRIGVTGNVMAYHWMPPLTPDAAPGSVLDEMLKVNPNLEYGKDVVIGRSPIGPRGESGAQIWGALGETFAFTVRAAEDPRTIPTILRMLNDNLSDQEQYRFIISGVEGVHYDIDDQGNVIKKKELGGLQEVKNIGFHVFNGGLLNPEFDKKANPVFYDFMDKTKNRGYIPFPVISTEETTRYGSDLGKLTLQTYIKIILGEAPLSDFDSYVETFRAQGGDAVLASIN